MASFSSLDSANGSSKNWTISTGSDTSTALIVLYKEGNITLLSSRIWYMLSLVIFRAGQVTSMCYSALDLGTCWKSTISTAILTPKAT